MKNISHCNVTAEFLNDEQGPLISLTQQEGYEDPCTVHLHPFQLQSILAEFGVINTDKYADKTIAKLERRLMVLRDRIEALHDNLCNNSDLTWVATHATATMDIAKEFCHDLKAPPHGLPKNKVHAASPTKCNSALFGKQNTRDR